MSAPAVRMRITPGGRRLVVARRAAARWTPDEDEILRAHYGRIPLADLARRVGRSETAVKLRLQDIHAERAAGCYSLASAGEVLGVSYGTIRAWVRRGYLPTRYGAWGCGRGRPQILEEADLLALVDAHPELLDLKRMPIGIWRTRLLEQQGQAHRSKTIRYWTPAEDQRMLHLLARGKTNAEIAQTLGRAKEAVHARITLLRDRGVHIPHNRGSWPARVRTGSDYQVEPWQPDEDAWLREHWGRLRVPTDPPGPARITTAECVRYLGRTESAIEARVDELKLRRERGPQAYKQRPWTTADEARLVALWQERADPVRGCRTRDIAAIAGLLDRTVVQVRRRAAELELPCGQRGGWPKSQAERAHDPIPVKEAA